VELIVLNVGIVAIGCDSNQGGYFVLGIWKERFHVLFVFLQSLDGTPFLTMLFRAHVAVAVIAVIVLR
jgi:hypothetical protein